MLVSEESKYPTTNLIWFTQCGENWCRSLTLISCPMSRLSHDCRRYFPGLFGSSAAGLTNFASSTGTFCFTSLT